MKRFFSILLAISLLSPTLFAQAEEVHREAEQHATQLPAAPTESKLPPLPEIVTSNWALVFPGACLALIAWNVGWRSRRRPPNPRSGGSDD